MGTQLRKSRDKMIAGQPARMAYRDMFAEAPALWGGMLPADPDGPTAPPAGAPAPMIEVDDDQWDPPNFPVDRLDVWNATAHLFFVEPPASATGWWDRSVESHPSIEARVEALGQMGSGIPPEAIERARAAGERFRAAGPRDISATSRR